MKANDIRKGIVVIYEGQPCRVMDFQHRTPGNLRAFVQVRMRNLSNGNSFETRFSSTEDLETARLDTKEMQVMYDDGTDVHVMDSHTYEQFTFDSEVVGRTPSLDAARNGLPGRVAQRPPDLDQAPGRPWRLRSPTPPRS